MSNIVPPGSVRDCHLDKRMKQMFLRPIDFVTGATCVDPGPATLTAGYPPGTGVPLWNIGSSRSGYNGLRFSGAGNATISYAWRPWDVDNAHPVYCRLWWTSDSLLANVATFDVTYSTVSAALILATPTTTLTQRPVSVAKAAAFGQPVFTRLGMIAPLATTAVAGQTFSPEIDAVTFAISVSTMSNGAIASDFVWLMGMELLYTSKDTFGDGSRRQARYLPVILGNQEADPSSDRKGV